MIQLSEARRPPTLTLERNNRTRGAAPAPPPAVLVLNGDGRMRGGPITFLRLTLERLDRAELRAQVIGLGDGKGIEELQRAGAQHGFPVEVWPASRMRDVVWFWRTARRLLVRVRRDRIQLIVANNIKEHLLGGTVAAMARIPCAWVSHQVWEKDVSYSDLVRLIPAQAIIANSQTTYDALPPSLRPKARVLPFGPEPPRLDSATRARAAALRDSWGHPSAVIVCVGVFAPEKGQHWLLEAAPSLVRSRPDLKIVLVGDDPRAAGTTGPTYRDRLVSLVRHAHLEHHVIFYGYTDDIYPPLLAADVVVHPSVVPETFGFSLVEAMLAGKPVVAANLGAQAEHIQDGRTGLLVPPASVAVLAASVQRLIDDPALARRLGSAAQQRASGRYTADAMAAAMHALMLDLITTGRGGRATGARRATMDARENAG